MTRVGLDEWLRVNQFLERQFGLSVSHSLSQQAADKMMQEIEELNRVGSSPEHRPPPPAPPGKG